MIDVLLAAVLALQLLDFTTTAYALRHRLATEANPVMSRLMGKIGVIQTLTATKGTVAALGVFLWHSGSVAWLVVLAASYAIVTFNNIRLIVKARKGGA